MAKYYLVVAKIGGVWDVEHGTYDRKEAVAELDIAKQSGSVEAAKIVSCLDVIEEIQRTIEGLNND